MERKISSELLKWKKEQVKPLLLYGPKQIGKTYAVFEFGKRNYKNIAYFNTENNRELLTILKQEFNLEANIEPICLILML